mgnify:CR=1 FL=1
MKVSHVEKNNVEQSSTVIIVNLQGVFKPSLGLDLIDPRSSFASIAPLKSSPAWHEAQKASRDDLFSSNYLVTRPQFR